MITRNFKNIVHSLLQSFGSAYGMLRVVNVSGTPYYFSPQFGKFPNSRTSAYTANATAAGISFGTDGTPPTLDDYNLGGTITSGLDVVLNSSQISVNRYDQPFVKYTFTITNNTSSTVTIREVGYKQIVNAAITPGRNSSSEIVILIDRSVLETPLQIEAGDAGILSYQLNTIPEPPRKVNGIDIVSFEWGTDAQLGTIIDAAHAGVLDLQEDCGWKIGDIRKIRTSAFVGGGNVNHAAQDIDIVISSFDDYMDCGCVMQFDYREELATGQRMNSTNTTSGGYKACEMYTTTLPAMAEAQPDWIKSRLLPFDVIAGTDTVSNNKLALRSTMEIFGSKQNAQQAEGEQIPYYKTSANRIKIRGYSGSANNWWGRSVDSSSYFCYVNNNGSANYSSASHAHGLAPFGCI